MSLKSICALVALCAVVPIKTSGAQDKQASVASSDREAVIAAGRDYIEGFYEGDTAKLARALRPDMSKYGVLARFHGQV